MSATEWRAGGAARRRERYETSRNLRKQVGKTGKARSRRDRDTRRMNMELRDLAARHVAYMRYVGPYGPHGIPELWIRFRRWLAAHDLTTAIRLGIAYDDPSITPSEKCRYDACVIVPHDFVPDAAVNVMDVTGGRYAVAPFVGTGGEIEGVWHRVFTDWLPASGYEPDDRPCFELYRRCSRRAGGYIAARAYAPDLAIGPAYDRAMQELVYSPLGMTRPTSRRWSAPTMRVHTGSASPAATCR